MHVKVSVDSLLLQPSDNIRQYVNVGLVNLYTLYTINRTMTGAVTDLSLYRLYTSRTAVKPLLLSVSLQHLGIVLHYSHITGGTEEYNPYRN